MTPRRLPIVGTAALLAFLALPSLALAGNVIGTTSGFYSNPTPTKGDDPDMSYKFTNNTYFGGGNGNGSGSGGTNFRWGDKGDYGVGRNQLWWDKTSPINAQTETDFKLGTLTYFNGTTELGTNPDTIDLTINLTLSDPNVGSQDFNYQLGLKSTPNDSGSKAGDADYVYLPTTFPSHAFNLGGVLYTLEVLGFRNATSNGSVGEVDTREFHVKEGKTASAELWGRVTAHFPGAPGVPEPASIVSAAVAGLIGLGIAVRRRRSEARA